MKRLPVVCFVLWMAVVDGAVAHAKGPQLEVAHWWTSKGESMAIAVVQKAFEERGYDWKDISIEGGGGDVLIARLRGVVAAGNPPAAVQVFMGPNLRRWAQEGFLVDLSDVAREGRWAEMLPPQINEMIQYKGKYVGAPTNAHRVNSMWVNPLILKEVGAEPPTTWEEFLDVAEKVKVAGYIALALGGQAWQEATLFETIVLGLGGVEFHRQAFIELNPTTLGSDTMAACFAMLRRVLAYVDPDFPDRTWDAATKMVIDGKAAIQIMGDWAKGEFHIQGKVPGKNFFCLPAPGTRDNFLICTDTIAMFRTDSAEIAKAQKELAKVIMLPEVQKQFNIIKGSVPVRMDIGCGDFDSCACVAMNAFLKSAKDKTISPSMAYSQAYNREMTELMTGLVGAFVHSDMMPEQAAKKMASLALLAN